MPLDEEDVAGLDTDRDLKRERRRISSDVYQDVRGFLEGNKDNWYRMDELWDEFDAEDYGLEGFAGELAVKREVTSNVLGLRRVGKVEEKRFIAEDGIPDGPYYTYRH